MLPSWLDVDVWIVGVEDRVSVCSVALVAPGAGLRLTGLRHRSEQRGNQPCSYELRQHRVEPFIACTPVMSSVAPAINRSAVAIRQRTINVRDGVWRMPTRVQSKGLSAANTLPSRSWLVSLLGLLLLGLPGVVVASSQIRPAPPLDVFRVLAEFFHQGRVQPPDRLPVLRLAGQVRKLAGVGLQVVKLPLG